MVSVTDVGSGDCDNVYESIFSDDFKSVSNGKGGEAKVITFACFLFNLKNIMLKSFWFA